MKVLLHWLLSILALYIVGAGGYSFIVMENWFNPADWVMGFRTLFLTLSFAFLLVIVDYDSKIGL